MTDLLLLSKNPMVFAFRPTNLIVKSRFPFLLLCLFVLVGFTNLSFAQTPLIDSLSVLIKTEKEDTSKVIHLNAIAREFINLGLYDSTLNISKKSLQTSEFALNKKPNESTKKVLQNCIALANTNMGLINWRQGNYSQALDCYSKALSIQTQLNNKNQIAAVLSSSAGVYLSQGNHTRANEYYLQALKVAEQLEDKKIIAKCFYGIGNVYGELKDFKKTLDYYTKALNIYIELGPEDKVASLFLNLGTIYYEQKKLDTSMNYYEKAKNIFEKIGDKNGLAYIFGDIGLIYHLKGELKKEINKKESDSLFALALPNFSKALQINKELGTANLEAVQLGNIGSLYLSQNKYKEAETYLLKALAIDTVIGYIFHLENTHTLLSSLYSRTGNYKKALEHSLQKEIIKDSIFNMEKNKDLTRQELTYQFEKKEVLAKAEQEKTALLANEKSKKQKVIIFSTVALLAVVALFLFFVYRSLQVSKKQNEIIEKQKHKVELQNEEITWQKFLVEEKNKEISDSITYAKRIQSSFLTSETYIKRYFSDYFILYKPKDVVSGDFYWMHAKDNYLYFCVGDCTGHGIPGAFMSLIGMGILNEIIYSKQLENTNEILDELRRIVILALNPEGAKEEGKDGMDLILGKLNTTTLELQYSTANNSFYVNRNNELLKFRGDKMPVGKHYDIERPFTSHYFQLQPSDTIYASTDGFYDQFGGPNERKIMTKGFETHLTTIGKQPFDKQKNCLQKIFTNWKGSIEQIDDVTVVGIKI